MSRRSRRAKFTATSFSYQDSDSPPEDEDSDYEAPDLLNSIFGMVMQNIIRSSSSRRRRPAQKKTPAKRRRTATTGPCCGQEHCAANMFSRQNRATTSPAAGSSGVSSKRSTKHKSKHVLTPLVDLDSDDDVKISDSQKKNISSKLDNFFKQVESSDEDYDTKFKKDEKPATVVKNSDFYTILSDDDDEEDPVKVLPSRENSFSQPSTSAGNGSGILNVSQDEDKEKKKEDLFAFVDDILMNCDDLDQANSKNGTVKTLEDLKKKTEEILGSVSTLIDDLNPNKKAEQENPPAEPAEAPSCPICFEAFGENLQRMVTMCGHMFCEPCIKEVARTIKKCPTCRNSVTSKKYHAIYI